jgi:hypothetical protein
MGRFYNHKELVEKPLSIHVFSDSNLEELLSLKKEMIKAENRIVLFLFLGTAGLWVVSSILEGSIEFLKIVGMIIGVIIFIGFFLYIIFWM